MEPKVLRVRSGKYLPVSHSHGAEDEDWLVFMGEALQVMNVE